ncbi:MAG TPA: class I SAM-dependent methyltransferase, partial [Amycolatopsis sp.]|nr:class I SAM-dependent methyltransferase [Amycolatopsis sp.]
VFGLDYFDKSKVSGPRLTVLRGDQNDPAQLEALAKEHGPFDIVIDDGSHINEHVLTSFHALFPHVRTGGFYVIEDLWTSYLPGYGGDDRDFGVPHTMLGLLKTLMDDLHHQERDGDQAPTVTESSLVGMHVYHNIAFLEKGVNAEGGIPRWMPRAPHW